MLLSHSNDVNIGDSNMLLNAFNSPEKNYGCAARGKCHEYDPPSAAIGWHGVSQAKEPCERDLHIQKRPTNHAEKIKPKVPAKRGG